MAEETSRIGSLYAFVMTDPRTNVEGVVSLFDEETATHVPMVAARPDIVKEWEPLVIAMVEQSGVKIDLVKFSVRELCDEFIPTSVRTGG